jgi:hypothetical protein
MVDSRKGGRAMEQDDLVGRVDVIAKQLDDVTAAVGSLSQSVDRRFDQVDRRFDAVDARFDAVDRRFDEVERRFVDVDGRFEEMGRATDEAFLEQVSTPSSSTRSWTRRWTPGSRGSMGTWHGWSASSIGSSSWSRRRADGEAVCRRPAPPGPSVVTRCHHPVGLSDRDSQRVARRRRWDCSTAFSAGSSAAAWCRSSAS